MRMARFGTYSIGVPNLESWALIGDETIIDALGVYGLFSAEEDDETVPDDELSDETNIDTSEVIDNTSELLPVVRIEGNQVFVEVPLIYGSQAEEEESTEADASFDELQ